MTRQRGAVGTVIVVVAAVTAATAFVTGLPRARLAAPARRDTGVLARRAMPADPSTTYLSALWKLPTVDKDVKEYYSGRHKAYAWVQTGETMYLFCPYPGGIEDKKPNVKLTIKDEGININLNVEGNTVLQGKLAHAVKPGSEIWMLEEAPGKKVFVVVEMDKMIAGREWTSVMEPHVEFVGDYSKASYSYPIVDEAVQAESVEETLRFLQKDMALKVFKEPGYEAENGDRLTVDIEGFQMAEDGSRGGKMGEPSMGIELELGEANGGGLSPEIHEQLVGVQKGETRDMKVKLGQRAGGKEVIIAVTVNKLAKLDLPELNDAFAKKVKEKEQFMQAATEDGIPWEEQGIVETFTLDSLRAEILREIRVEAEKKAKLAVQDQLRQGLVKTAKVTGEWADLTLGQSGQKNSGVAPADLVKKEEEAAAVRHMLMREGLDKMVDLDMVERQTWNRLGTPKFGEDVAEVGSDPSREFQAARRAVIRRHRLDEAIAFMEQTAEVIAS